MDDITKSKYDKKNNKESNYLSKLVSRILISIIFLLVSLIYTNISNSNYSLYKEKVLNSNIRYTKIKNIYEKYFGKVLPNKKTNDVAVFSNNNSPQKIEPYQEGEKIIYEENNMIEALQSGIVVYMGNKDDLGYTIIVQGVDDIDIWYSNINNSSLKLYDYVEKGKIIGEVDKELIINIIKDKDHLKYEEYLKTI